MDMRIIEAYRVGVNDGFFYGDKVTTFKDDDLIETYNAGYDHGVWMYCETMEEEK